MVLTLLKGVLLPKLLNIPIACLLPQFAQFDCIINLFCLFLTILELSFLVYFLHTKQKVSFFVFYKMHVIISACNYFNH